jgi:hypothetical protein
MPNDELEPIDPGVYVSITDEEIGELVATMRDYYNVEVTREEARRYMSRVPTAEEIEEAMEGV